MRYNFSCKAKQTLKPFFIVTIFSFVFFSVAHFTFAATLNILPSNGNYAVGDTFTGTVTVDSADQATNAIDATVSFPVDKLQVTTISKDGSIINLWAGEPAYSNDNGTVTLSGVVLNPGFTGNSGKVLKINFKVKSSGKAPVVFSSGSVLANDGRGTNILTSLNGAQYTLGPSVAKPPVMPTTTTKSTSKTPTTPTVTETPITVVNTPVTPPVVKDTAFSFLSPAFFQGLKLFAINASVVALLLLIIALICFIVFRSLHAIMFLRARLRREKDADNKNQDKILELQGKLMEAEQLAETSKSELAYQVSMFAAERTKKDQALEENKKLASLYEQDSSKRAYALKEKEESWAKELENSRAQSEEEKRKLYNVFNEKQTALHQEIEGIKSQTVDLQKELSEKEHVLDETKSQLAYQVNLLSIEKAKHEETVESHKNSANSFEERESSLKKELENVRTSLEQEVSDARKDIIALNRKLTETEHSVDEARSKAMYQESLLVSEKSKHEQDIAEHQGTITTLKETESSLKQELKDTKMALEKERGNEDEKFAEYKKSLAEAERTLAETKSELIHNQELLASQKDKFKNSEEENQKYISILREKELALAKATDAIEGYKEKESGLKAAVASLQEKVSSTEGKLNEALAREKEIGVALSAEQELFNAEKGKREVSEEEHKKIALLLSEKESEFEKKLNDMSNLARDKENDFEKKLEDISNQNKEKEENLKKKIEESGVKVKDAEAKFAEVLKQNEEINTELSKTKKNLAAEQDKTKSLMAAVSKLILPENPNPPVIPNS